MINKKILSIWLNDNPEIPEVIKKCLATHSVEGYEHHLITLDNCPMTSRYVREAISAKKWVKAADLLRMQWLFENGGIYLDADIEILPGKNFDEMLNDRLFMGTEKNKYYANAVVGAEPGHPLLKEYIRRIEENFRGDGDLVFEPGIRAFTDLVFIHKDNPANGIKIYEYDYFYPTDNSEITENTMLKNYALNSWVTKKYYEL